MSPSQKRLKARNQPVGAVPSPTRPLGWRSGYPRTLFIWKFKDFEHSHHDLSFDWHQFFQSFGVMAYKLLIGQKSYSSWSLRGWLCFAPFGIPVDVTKTVIYSDHFYDDVSKFGGNRTVPTVLTPQGGTLTDSLGVAWHLSEVLKDKRLLPSEAKERAEAMSLIAEMHSGFSSIRNDCPMNLRTAWEGFEPSDAVLKDCARAEQIWSTALNRSGGPFLFGEYTLADAFFTPLASRFVTYKLPASETSQAYAKALLSLPEVTRWRAEGLEEDEEVDFYDMAPLERVPFEFV